MNKSNSLQNPKTVSIVGGGIGGLASAILLAKQGYKVSLYEKNECLGGRASILHKDGYTFDMGPSRYLMPDIFEEFFESIDENIHDYLDLKQLSPSYRVFYGDDKKNKTSSIIDIFNKHIPNNDLSTYQKLYKNITDPTSCSLSDYKKENGTRLMYIGDRHSAKYPDNDYTFIKESFYDFIQIKDGKPKIVLIEGGVDWDIPDNEKDFVHWKQLSTASYLKFLAMGANIPFDSPELGNKKEKEELLRAGYTMKEISIYNLIRFLRTTVGIQGKAINNELLLSYFPNKESVERNIQYFIDETGLSIYNLTVENIKNLVDPTSDYSKFNNMRRIIGFMREKAILESIDHYISNGYNVFITYGHGHRELHKPILEEYFINNLGRDAISAHPQNEGQNKNTLLQHLDIYADSKRMSDIFESMEPGAGKQFLTFLERAKIQYEIGMEFCKKNYDSIFDFFRRDIMRKGIKLNIRTTIDHYVARFFRNQLIRKIMQYTTVFLGTAPKSTPALYNIMSHCDFNMGVRYPKGGLHEIAKALHKIGLKHGVEYHLNTEVVGCEIKDNQIQSLKINKKYNNIPHINFYNQETWDWIMSGNKTIETRALNPEEPEKYFGNIMTGDLVTFVNKITGEKVIVKIKNTYIWKNFEQLRNEDPSTVSKIYSDHKKFERIKSIEEFKLGWNFTPDYIDRAEKHGLVGWEFEIVSKHQTIQSDIYLINADMAWFETSVLPSDYQSYPKTYRDKKIFAPSGFIIYAGVNKKLPKLDHHNLYFCEDRDKNFGQIFDTKELPTDPSIYVSKITHTDPSMAPEGCENLFILVPIPNGIEMSDNQKEQYKNMVRKIVEQMAGEEIVGYIDVEEIFTIDNFKSRYNSWNGTALGLAHPIMQTAVFRANNISKKLDNLFYVGHNTNPGIGVPMVIISAQLALERVQKRDSLNQK